MQGVANSTPPRRAQDGRTHQIASGHSANATGSRYTNTSSMQLQANTANKSGQARRCGGKGNMDTRDVLHITISTMDGDEDAFDDATPTSSDSDDHADDAIGGDGSDDSDDDGEPEHESELRGVAVSAGVAAGADAGDAPTPVPMGCQHYTRKARIIAPCCGEEFWCRLWYGGDACAKVVVGPVSRRGPTGGVWAACAVTTP